MTITEERKHIMQLINDPDYFEYMTEREIDYSLQDRLDNLKNCIDRTNRENLIYDLLVEYFKD